MSGSTPPTGTVTPSTESERPRRVMCVKCFESIEKSYAYCPHCGTSQTGGDTWYYHPVWILILALVALGPFALILVWKSKKMTPAVRIVLAIVIGIYSFYTVYYGYKLFMLSYREFSDLSTALGGIH